MAEQVNAERNREAKLFEMWEGAAEEIALETLERQVQAAVRWLGKARAQERAAMNAYSFACRTRERIAKVGEHRIFRLRSKGRFGEADKALQLTQEYLHGLHAMERKMADNSLSQEELCARMECWAQECEFSLPEAE